MHVNLRNTNSIIATDNSTTSTPNIFLHIFTEKVIFATCFIVDVHRLMWESAWITFHKSFIKREKAHCINSWIMETTYSIRCIQSHSMIFNLMFTYCSGVHKKVQREMKGSYLKTTTTTITATSRHKYKRWRRRQSRRRRYRCRKKLKSI